MRPAWSAHLFAPALFALSLFSTASAATLYARPLAAQVVPTVETSVPFDSAGRITVLTPTLVSRLRLAAPAWPVHG